MLRLEMRPYRRPFRRSLTTHHGPWSVRTGLLLRLTDGAGRVGWGEVAPIPWFGTETLAAAQAYLQHLGPQPSLAAIQATPDSLPACQFGLQAALHTLAEDWPPPLPLTPQNTCALLPAGEAALSAWSEDWQRGHRTFKGKIGVFAPEAELAWLERLCAALPTDATLRLDANGGLTPALARRWLQRCGTRSQVEFLEQPLPVQNWAELRSLAAEFPGKVALDESVATLPQLASVVTAGWSGPVVIKPAIAGHPDRLRQRCQSSSLQVVLSSALETPVGQTAALRLAATLPGAGDRALGFGVGHWFADDWAALSPEALWQRL